MPIYGCFFLKDCLYALCRGGGGQGESLYAGHPHVEEFTASNFLDGQREVAIVEFYAPWCAQPLHSAE